MRYVFKDTSVLTLAQGDSEKGRGVFCNSKGTTKCGRLLFYTTLLVTNC